MAGVRNFLVRAALTLSLFLPLFFLVSALATKFGLVDWRLGFATLTLQVGPLLIIIAALLALIALIVALITKPRAGRRAALIALLIPLSALGVAAYAVAGAARVPPIHDIVTDAQTPLTFSDAVMAARAATPGGNPVEADPRVPNDPRFAAAAGRRARELQQEAYPDIAPIVVPGTREAAFEKALAAATSLGWTIDRADAAEGRIEARVESFWFGFVDDVVVEVTPAENGARIDVRSTSRVGVSDLGANAARVRAFRDALS